ncbi:transthyretin-like family domain-containing protein [Ditylenchus destructor]|nr:transthyretin-like family domain-containing protein [Ditylenchus destructor]
MKLSSTALVLFSLLVSIFLVSILLVSVILINPLASKQQSYSVSGKILCRRHMSQETHPYINATVKLFDEDLGWLGDDDDLLGTAQTDENGSFKINGYTEEFGQIDPVLEIIIPMNHCTKCAYSFVNKPGDLCVKKMHLPDSYIRNGSGTSLDNFDAGDFIVPFMVEDEKDCANKITLSKPW